MGEWKKNSYKCTYEEICKPAGLKFKTFMTDTTDNNELA